MPKPNPLILASGSPRRKSLLKTLGLNPKIAPPHIDETQKPGENARAYVRRMARQKAGEIVSKIRSKPNAKAWILAADTIVVFGRNQVLGKPTDRQEAKKFLKILSGKKHRVMTCCCLAASNQPASRWTLFTVDSVVTFRELNPFEIEFYLKTGDWKDKAGAYGIQDKGAFLVETMAGSFTNIVGLPMKEVATLLKKHRIL